MIHKPSSGGYIFWRGSDSYANREMVSRLRLYRYVVSSKADDVGYEGAVQGSSKHSKTCCIEHIVLTLRKEEGKTPREE